MLLRHADRQERSVIRNRSDWILGYMLRPVLASRYELIRADQISEPGSITVQVVRLLAEADLAITDLTGLNANVVYELGVRHTLNKPAIQVMDRDQELPFDLIGERTIFFKHDDMRSLEQAKSELRRAVKQTEREGLVCTSPISRAVDISDLLTRPTEARNQLATILQELLNVKVSMDSIVSDQSLMGISLTELDSAVSDIKDALEMIGPQDLSRGGIYIEDRHIIRLLEDIELLLKRSLARP
jgi:hypothetical protein